MTKKAEIRQFRDVDIIGMSSDGEESKILPVKEEDIKETKSSPLFKIIEAIFTNKNYIANMTEQQANQNVFMILRRMAINYPVQANVFNNNKINALDVVKFWSDYLYCGRVPRWAYESGKSKGDKAKKSPSEITKSDIAEYVAFYDIDRKSFESAMRLFPEETVNDVNEFKKFIKHITSNNVQNDVDNK